MKIQVSHGAPLSNGNVEWFIVRPLPGEITISGITNEMALQSLVTAGRTVYELDVVPWRNRRREPPVVIAKVEE